MSDLALVALGAALGFLMRDWTAGWSEVRTRTLNRIDLLRRTLATALTRNLRGEADPVPQPDHAVILDCLDALWHEPLYDPVNQCVKVLRLAAQAKEGQVGADKEEPWRQFSAKAAEYLGGALKVLTKLEADVTGPLGALRVWWRRWRGKKQS